MADNNQRGSLLLPLVIVITLLLGSLGFGIWAFAGMQDYKNNTDAKIADAVEESKKLLTIEKEAQFAEELKNPNKTYTGPSAYGSLKIVYPKTWSAYVDETSKTVTPLNGYMHPDFVPATTNKDINYAFRFEVINQSYDTELAKASNQVRAGSAQVSAYRAPKVPGALGAKVTGDIQPQKQGIMVLLPLRDKTIKIWTEGDKFTADYNKILENLTFVP